MSETYDEVIRRAAGHFETQINCIADPPEGGMVRVRVHIYGDGGTILGPDIDPPTDLDFAVDSETGYLRDSLCIRRITSVEDDDSYPWEGREDPEYAPVRSFALHLELDPLLRGTGGPVLHYFFSALLLQESGGCVVLTE